MKIGTRTQFLTLILLLTLIYTFWIEIILGFAHLYALTGNPHSRRLLGEYYATRANEDTAKAAVYFQQALEGYKMALPGTPKEQRKWIEFLIGNQYECGKGLEPDLEEAKYWYKKAIKSGLPTSSKSMLDQIYSSLRDIQPMEKKHPSYKEKSKRKNKTS